MPQITPTRNAVRAELHSLRERQVRCGRLMISLRWIAGALVLAGAIVGWLSGWLTGAVAGVGVAVLAYNCLLRALWGRIATESLWFWQMAADVTAMGALLFFWGGIGNPVAYLFVAYMACVGTFVPARQAYVIATLAAVLFIGVGAVRNGLLLQVVANVVVFSLSMYLMVWLSATVSGLLRKREEEMATQSDMLDSIMSSMSDGLIFVTADGKPGLWNSVAEEWFFPGADPDRCLELGAYLKRVRDSDSPLPDETFWIVKQDNSDGSSRHLKTTSSKVFDGRSEHVGYLIVAEDMTGHLQLEQSLRARNLELSALTETLKNSQNKIAEREKMVAVGTMAAGVAHEVGNPLACLSAIVQVLKKRLRSETDQEHLRTLQEQIQRIVKIVRGLLDFARPGSGDWAVTDLDELIDKTLKIFRYSRRSRHAQIESVRNSSLPKVRIVPDQFQQVLINLVLNALDAVESKGGSPAIVVERAVEDGWVNVKVSDQGIGMTAQQARQAFEPFCTTKPPGKGSGLGLAVSYMLVKRQGGRINIASTPGEGTVVTVSLPVDKSQANVVSVSNS